MLPHVSFLYFSGIHFRESIFYLSMAIIAVVFVLLIVSLITFQRSKSSLGVEMVWAVIPLVMLFVMLVPIVNVLCHH